MKRMVVAETERCRVRWLTLDDAPFILELLNSPGWINNIGDRKVYNEEQARNYLSVKVIPDYASKGFGMYGVELKETNELIGNTGLIDRPGLEGIDVGFAILPEYMQKGFTYEATLPILDQAKSLKIEKLVAITLPSNTGSRKLLEKLEFQMVKEFYMEGDPELLCLYELVL